MRAEQRDLSKLAESVADGNPVDWTVVEQKGTPADRRLIGHLRLVESIANLHRSISEIDDDYAVTRGAASKPVSRGQDEPRPVPGTGDAHWGRLTLLDRIGEGTSCEVYRAWDTSLHREVALKLFHEDGGAHDTHRRMLDEARRMARVQHQHVVQVYGAEEHDHRVGLWMELVRGESLEQVVKARGALGPREAALIGLDLCSALAAVHAAGLLHRDVKAQNVMREERGRIVLMDFGTGEDLSGSNRLVGTPLYLAPEIFRGQKASVQSDLYSLGVLLFYLVTAKFPVVAGSMEHLARAHAQHQRRALRDLRPDASEAFVATVERALDSDPARRFQTVGDFEAALRQSLDVPSPRPAVAPPVSRPGLATSWAPSWTFASLALALVALVAALIVWTGNPFGARAGAVKTLAVLPLVDRSAVVSPELADALTEQLIATIGTVDSLRATSIMSMLPFKGSTQPRTEIAAALGVDAVLEGVLTVSDEPDGTPGRLRLDVKVIRAGSGAQLWSGSVVRKRGESAALLSEVVGRITDAVDAPVTTTEAARLGQAKSTSVSAEEAYLQGRMHLTRYGGEASDRALKYFQRAIDADPNFAAAHASAALAYLKLASYGFVSHSEARLKAAAAISAAAATGEDNAEAHAVQAGFMFLYDWDWDGAERELQRSLELNPGSHYARHIYAELLAAEQRFDEMLRMSEETLQMDPQSTEVLINHAILLYYKRDYPAADEVLRRAVAMDPGNGRALIQRGRVLEALKRYDEALAVTNEAAKLLGNAGVSLRIVQTRLLALAGHVDQARAETQALEQAGRDGSLLVRPRDLAYLYEALGRKDDALTEFERALDERDPSLVWLTVTPRVDSLRSEPRFQAILQQIVKH